MKDLKVLETISVNSSKKLQLNPGLPYSIHKATEPVKQYIGEIAQKVELNHSDVSQLQVWSLRPRPLNSYYYCNNEC